MKRFKEFLDEKEEQEYINEQFTVGALIDVFGLSSMLLVGGFGAYLLYIGYTKAGKAIYVSIKNMINKLKGGKGDELTTGDVADAIGDIKDDRATKIVLQDVREDEIKYIEEFADVYKAIREKDSGFTKELLKRVQVDEKTKTRLVIVETTRVFKEPPLHHGNTGNPSYLFVKKVLGIKIAQAASTAVKKALEKQGISLVKDININKETEV